MPDKMTARLDDFRLRINIAIAHGERTIPVRDNDGNCPVVVALDEERLAVLLSRVWRHGGYANVFTEGAGGIRHLSFMDVSGALDTKQSTKMTGAEQPGPTSTVGMFVDYLSHQQHGIVLPARLRSAETGSDQPRPRQVELIH